MKRIQLFHEGLLSISGDSLADDVGLDQALRRVAEGAADLLNVERVVVWLRSREHRRFYPAAAFSADGQTLALPEIEPGKYPELFEALKGMRVLSTEDAATDPRTRRLVEDGAVPLPAGSILGTPVRDGAELVGGVCFHDPKPGRQWDAAEQQVAASVGDIVALALRKAEQEQTERALRRTLAELERQKEALDRHAIISVTDPDGIIIEVNDKFCEVSGYRRDELIGQSHRILNSGHHPPDFFEAMWRTLSRGETWEGEIRNRTKDGRHYWVEATIVPFLDEMGRVERFVAIHTEVTAILEAKEALGNAHAEKSRQLDQVQKQLLQSEKLASIGQLAAGVAHEINNPVGYINSNVSTLESYLDDLFGILALYEQAESDLASESGWPDRIAAAKRQVDLDYIKEDLRSLIRESKEGLERVRQIIQDLKDFSRVTDGKVEIFDLHRGLDSTLNIMHNELKYKAEVVREYGTLPPVQGVPSQLNQVFMNLLVNAAQAIEEHGTITVRTGTRGDRVWVQVEDTGCGIAPEHMHRLFDPFFTTKPVGQGTGLGLAVSHGIVEKHGGRIEVESQPGLGTTFTVWLPAQSEEVAHRA